MRISRTERGLFLLFLGFVGGFGLGLPPEAKASKILVGFVIEVQYDVQKQEGIYALKTSLGRMSLRLTFPDQTTKTLLLPRPLHPQGYTIAKPPKEQDQALTEKILLYARSDYEGLTQEVKVVLRLAAKSLSIRSRSYDSSASESSTSAYQTQESVELPRGAALSIAPLSYTSPYRVALVPAGTPKISLEKALLPLAPGVFIHPLLQPRPSELPPRPPRSEAHTSRDAQTGLSEPPLRIEPPPSRAEGPRRTSTLQPPALQPSTPPPPRSIQPPRGDESGRPPASPGSPARTTIRRFDLRTQIYTPNCNGNDPWEVKQGHYKDKENRFEVKKIVYGDLDQDGEEEAVVLTVCNTGGTGFFSELVVWGVRGGAATKVASMPAGDRAHGGIHAIRLEGGRLWVSLYGTSGGACCPEYTDTLPFVLKGDQLSQAGLAKRQPYKRP